MPVALSHSEVACSGEEYYLEPVSWPLRVDIEENLDRILHEYQALSRQVERGEHLQAESPSSTDGTGDQLRRLWEYEHEAARLAKLIEDSTLKTGSSGLVGSSKSFIGVGRKVFGEGPEGQKAEEILQTRTIPAGEVVRGELPRWIPALKSE